MHSPLAHTNVNRQHLQALVDGSMMKRKGARLLIHARQEKQACDIDKSLRRSVTARDQAPQQKLFLLLGVLLLLGMCITLTANTQPPEPALTCNAQSSPPLKLDTTAPLVQPARHSHQAACGMNACSAPSGSSWLPPLHSPFRPVVYNPASSPTPSAAGNGTASSQPPQLPAWEAMQVVRARAKALRFFQQHNDAAAAAALAEAVTYAPHDDNLRLIAIKASAVVKDYAKMRLLCLDGMNCAQCEFEYRLFQDLLAHLGDQRQLQTGSQS